MTFLLPPRRAAWIPAGTTHRAIMRGVMAYRSLYFYQHQIYLSCQYRLLKSIHYF